VVPWAHAILHGAPIEKFPWEKFIIFVIVIDLVTKFTGFTKEDSAYAANFVIIFGFI